MNQSWNSTFIWLVSWNIECRQGVLGTFISKFWAPIVIDFTERCTSFPKKKESQRSTQKHAVQPTPFLQTKNQTRHFLHIQMKWNYPDKTETRKKKLSWKWKVGVGSKRANNSKKCWQRFGQDRSDKSDMKSMKSMKSMQSGCEFWTGSVKYVISFR